MRQEEKPDTGEASRLSSKHPGTDGLKIERDEPCESPASCGRSHRDY